MSKLLEALAVMAEVTGTDWSKPTVQVIERELCAYPESVVLGAVKRCMSELSRKVTLADILDRIPGQHPGVEHAWGLISKTLANEQLSICWTEEMREAYGAAAPLAGDPVAARMAFKEVYGKLVSEARATRRMPNWSVSLGWDTTLREECIQEAQRLNLISHESAQRLLPDRAPTVEAIAVLKKVGL